MIQLKLKPSPSPRNNLSHKLSTPVMSRRAGGLGAGDEFIEVGDLVEVPGGMDGTVKFVGEVRGKQGFFVGVELSKKWAHRGKNDGDAEGVRYFSTSVPGAGIFLPIARATKINSPPGSTTGSIPATPTTPFIDQIFHEAEDTISPTPAIPRKNFSQSMRAPSPAFKPKSRPSLPRPESPLRRTQVAPTTTPAASRQSLTGIQSKIGPARVAASPTPAKFGGSVRGVKPRPAVTSTVGRATSSAAATRQGNNEESAEVAALQAMIAEKNAKIAQLTADFDAHRADFRSTLDTLELASTETERVYEKKVEDLMHERQLLLAQGEDVESVAQQLRQLEEVVQELEEGLEDARRGEAEARGEVEFLRGEVERVRAELRRERERNVELVREVDDARRTRPRAKTVIRTPSKTNGSPGEPASDHNAESLATGGRIASPESTETITAHTEEKHNHLATDGPEDIPTTDLIQDSPTLQQDVLIKQPVAPQQATPMDDPNKWCALCEQDGHDSISCPFDKP